MKKITVQHRFAGQFKGLLQFQTANTMAIVTLDRLNFTGRDGKHYEYRPSSTFTALKADITSYDLEENTVSPLGDDVEKCPDCGTQLNINTFPTGDDGRLRQEAVCPGCGYTEA
jgi:hypothetical protein